jgi:hypothetical protein
MQDEMLVMASKV